MRPFGLEELNGLEVLAGFEPDGFPRRNVHFRTGARVSPDSGLSRLHGKHAKSPQLNAVVGFERCLHTLENCVDRLLGLGLAYARALDNLIHKIEFDHRLTS